MKLRRCLYLSLPLALVAGCVLPSFEVEPAASSAGGSAGSAGSGTSSGGMAGNVANQGGETSEAGSAGQPEPAVSAAADRYVVVQEDELTVGAPGVLANDDGELTVEMVEDLESDLPTAYQATFEIDADGELTFSPAPGFFGAYRLRYTVKNESGESAQADVTVYVQPVDVELAAVAENVGGFCVTGAAGAGVGSAVSGAGDLDGDGIDDLLIGAPNSDSDAGAVYVVLGGEQPRSFELTALAGSDEDERYFMFTGAAGVRLGTSVASVGPGSSDVLLGAPGAPGDDGVVYVLPAASTYAGSSAIADVDSAVFSGGPSDSAGHYVASGLDVTGDDVADPLVVVSLAADNNPGGYYLLDGDVLESGSLASEATAVIQGSSNTDNLTQAAAHVGDVDGDEENDVLLASSKVIALVLGPSSNFPADLASGSFNSSVGLHLARSSSPNDPVSLTSAGDFDGDGERDLAYCEGALDCVVVFGPPTDLSSGVSVSDLGGAAWISGGADLVTLLDGASDGASELLVAQRDDSPDADADQIFVLFGGSGQQAGSISVTGLGDAGFTLSAASGSDLQALTPVGNVNGDAWPDFAIGDAGNDQVCVVFGGPYLR